MPRHSIRKFVPLIPSELWLRIFRFATTSPESYKLYEIEYVPFRGSYGYDGQDEKFLPLLKKARQTKYSLVFVCKRWRELALEFLYEDVVINRWSQGLRDGLARSAQERGQRGYGRWVRRLELAILLDDEVGDCVIPDVLQWCPNLKFLVKFPYLPLNPLPSSITYSTLASLKRLDWICSMDLNSSLRDDPCELLTKAPNLQYLSIRIWRDHTGFGFYHPPLALTFNSLTTLRIGSISQTMRSEINEWKFPNLTHLILDGCRDEDGYALILSHSKIQVLELLPRLPFFMSGHIGLLPRMCPALRELNYPLGCNPPPPDYSFINNTIRCIRVYYEPCMLDPFSAPPNVRGGWSGVGRRFSALTGPIFQALEKVVLYGDWRAIVNQPRFPPLRNALLRRGCRLEYWDGTPVECGQLEAYSSEDGYESFDSTLSSP